MAKATLIKDNIKLGLAYKVRGSVHFIIKSGTWQHPGRNGVGGAESYTSCSEGKQEKTGFQEARTRVLQPIPTRDTSTPTRQRLLMVPLPSIFKPPHLPVNC